MATFRLLARILFMPSLLLACSVLPACGGGGGGDVGQEASVPIPREVGAVFIDPADGRMVLISKTGTRFVHFDVAQGTFTAPRPIAELLPGMTSPLVGGMTHDATTGLYEFGDLVGAARQLYDPATDTAGNLETWEDLGAGPSYVPGTSALFSLGSQLFMFSPGGSEYTAYDRSSQTWSPTFSFTGDFGGGGAPIPSVGAAAAGDRGRGIYLFDLSGTRWTIYSNGGNFSPAFTLDELGDGTLTFE